MPALISPCVSPPTMPHSLLACMTLDFWMASCSSIVFVALGMNSMKSSLSFISPESPHAPVSSSSSILNMGSKDRSLACWVASFAWYVF